jgi:hypothetical protein
MTSNEKIAAAALRLSESGVMSKIDSVISEKGPGRHNVLPVLWDHIKDILVVIRGGKQIAKALRETASFVSSETK